MVCLDGLELNLTNDDNFVLWLIAALRFEVLDFSHDALSVDDLTEDDVLLVQVRSDDGRNKELRAVGTLLCQLWSSWFPPQRSHRELGRLSRNDKERPALPYTSNTCRASTGPLPHRAAPICFPSVPMFFTHQVPHSPYSARTAYHAPSRSSHPQTSPHRCSRHPYHSLA